MLLQPIDWVIVGAFFAVSLGIGIAVSRRAGKSTREFFAAGSRMPWWLLGISMVATTFSTDTPNLVTNFVRDEGVAANWSWWAMLLTGMVTVFIYARLWKRSGVMTDVEFYELRYSGKAAAFLRGFRAVYLGLFFNVIIMASVTLAAIKISAVLLGLSPLVTVVVASLITVIYCSLGGLQGVLLTDLVQFALAMIGAIGAAIVALNLPEVGGLSGLLAHEAVQGKLSILPETGSFDALMNIFIVPLLVMWWAAWYPGAEPGGGGYIAQRMLAAKDENNALGAVFLFNAAHYALRPWPWILVGLCSLVVFPDVASIRAAFPTGASVAADDMGYPAMLTFLPAGLMGLVVASLAAAFMSTISTHLNWGASYLVHDLYQRFIRPEAGERELVAAGRLLTLLLMVLAAFLALQLESALQNFQLMLNVGAGTGLIFLLRWFWWRVNAMSEIAAMVGAFCVWLYFQFIHSALGFEDLEWWLGFTISVAFTTCVWVATTYATRPTRPERLEAFYRKVHPGGPGWKPVVEGMRAKGEDGAADLSWQMPLALLCVIMGSIAIYSTLIATGYWLYGRYGLAFFLTVVAVAATVILVGLWRKLIAHQPGLHADRSVGE